MKKASKRRILFAARMATMVGAACFAVSGISETLGQEKEKSRPVYIATEEVAETTYMPEIEETTQPTETAKAVETEEPLIASMDWDKDDSYLLCKIAMAEAESEGVKGKALVMLVVLNRVWSNEFPDTIEEVIFQKNQFSPVANGRYDAVEPDEECYEALKLIQVDHWNESQDALYFESKSDSKWHSENLEFLFKYGKYAAKYQSFDIISLGTVKVPKGTDVSEFSWDGVFFGASKKNEAIVKTNAWKSPNECVKILNDYMLNETVLTLIVTETWINVDVTISSFQPRPVGAYGNVEYSITFVQKKPLKIYSTNELKIAAFVRKTKPRASSSSSGGNYTVVSGDTLWGIASKKLGSGTKWTKIYDTNKDTIESTAKKHGKSSSDHGHWIWPGEVLTIPG